jgi:hypothetical protein
MSFNRYGFSLMRSETSGIEVRRNGAAKATFVFV